MKRSRRLWDTKIYRKFYPVCLCETVKNHTTIKGALDNIQVFLLGYILYFIKKVIADLQIMIIIIIIKHSKIPSKNEKKNRQVLLSMHEVGMRLICMYAAV